MGNTMKMLLSVLDFKPLDRLQINSAATIAEMRIDRQLYGISEPKLPFLYFQRILLDGRIEARSPAGAAVSISVLDVCDVIRGKQVIVRAMTRRGFRDRLASSARDRQSPPSDACFHPAYVLWAGKNRWNQVEPRVWFLDEDLNTDVFNSSHFIAPIHPDDRKRLDTAARRTTMPIANYRSTAASSADHGVRSTTDLARDVVAGFIKLAAQGKTEASQVLSSFGAEPLTRAQLNRLKSI